MLLAGMEPQVARLLGPRTERPRLTGLTIPLTKLYDDGDTAGRVVPFTPRRRPFSLRTPDLLVVPVNREVVDIIGTVHFRLPTRIVTGGTKQVDAILLTTLDQEGRVNIGGIDQVCLRGEVFFGQCLMDIVRAHRLMDRCRGRLDMGQQVRRRVLAGFTYMDHVACPLGAAFGAVAGVNIIGGFDVRRRPG